MSAKPSAWFPVAGWALSLIVVAAALVVAPAYLILDSQAAAPAAGYFAVSPGWTREILAAAHFLFLAGLLWLATASSARAVAGRVIGISIAAGIWEVLASAAGMLLRESPRFAPPNMTVAALGAMLLLSGIGLRLASAGRTIRGPRTPVVVVFAAGLALALAAFGLIGVFSVRHYARVDYTRSGRCSLPAATAALLNRLGKTVRITTLFVVGSEADDILKREVTDILDEYARTSPRIEVNHIDLHSDVKASKELAARLAVKGIKLEENAVVFECQDTGRMLKVTRHEMLPPIEPPLSSEELVNAATGGKPVSQSPPEFRFLGDSAFHQALSIVTSGRLIKLYFVVGHGEKPATVGPPGPRIPPDVIEQYRKVFSTELLQSSLRQRYYRIETLNLDEAGGGQSIPADCDVLVVAGPWFPYVAQYWSRQMQPFSDTHADLVRQYLARGGRAFFMIDPTGAQYAPCVEPLLSLLREYGVTVDVNHFVLDEVLDPQKGAFGQVVLRTRPSELFAPSLVRDYDVAGHDGQRTPQYHPCIAAISGVSLAVGFCAEVATAPVEGIRHSRLLRAGENSWLQRVMEPLDTAGKEKRQRTLAVAVEKADTGQPLMVVLGGSTMFIQPIIRYNGVAENQEFAEKAVAWLAGSTEQLAVVPRQADASYGTARASAVRAVRFVSVLVIPSVFVLIGAIVWLGRRK